MSLRLNLGLSYNPWKKFKKHFWKLQLKIPLKYVLTTKRNIELFTTQDSHLIFLFDSMLQGYDFRVQRMCALQHKE